MENKNLCKKYAVQVTIAKELYKFAKKAAVEIKTNKDSTCIEVNNDEFSFTQTFYECKYIQDDIEIYRGKINFYVLAEINYEIAKHLDCDNIVEHLKKIKKYLEKTTTKIHRI